MAITAVQVQGISCSGKFIGLRVRRTRLWSCFCLCLSFLVFRGGSAMAWIGWAVTQMRLLGLGYGVSGAKSVGQGEEASLSSLQRAGDKIQAPA